MRSKNQPRPSYRWPEKDENAAAAADGDGHAGHNDDLTAETAETAETAATMANGMQAVTSLAATAAPSPSPSPPSTTSAVMQQASVTPSHGAAELILPTSSGKNAPATLEVMKTPTKPSSPRTGDGVAHVSATIIAANVAVTATRARTRTSTAAAVNVANTPKPTASDQPPVMAATAATAFKCHTTTSAAINGTKAERDECDQPPTTTTTTRAMHEQRNSTTKPPPAPQPLKAGSVSAAYGSSSSSSILLGLMDSRAEHEDENENDDNMALDVDMHHNALDDYTNNNDNDNDEHRSTEYEKRKVYDAATSRGHIVSDNDNSNKLVVDNAKSKPCNNNNNNNSYRNTTTKTTASLTTTTTEQSAPQTKVERAAVADCAAPTAANMAGLTTAKTPMIATTAAQSLSTTTTPWNGECDNQEHGIKIVDVQRAAAATSLRPRSVTSGADRRSRDSAGEDEDKDKDGDARRRLSELASPRCLSRESNASGIVGDGRCPSNDSHCSGNESLTPAATPTPHSPPVGLPLTATLAPSAAAALLPPQSAAMAAYFNAAAAAAAQQNHLLLTNPLAAAASLVQQATQAHSPNSAAAAARLSASSRSPSSTGVAADPSALDFSTKRARRHSDEEADDDDDDADADGDGDTDEADDAGGAADANSPLDLSVGAGRKRQSATDDAAHMEVDGSEVGAGAVAAALRPSHKMARANDFKPLPPGTWVPPINPYLAAVAAASLSPNKPKMATNEALDKMTEMTRLGGSAGDSGGAAGASPHAMRHAPTSATTAQASGTNGRHSAWQSHWLNKGADAVKDVFKCVWCKQSFPTLASLTTHMKETQHCGVNVPPPPQASASSSSGHGHGPNTTSASSGGGQSSSHHHHGRHSGGGGSSHAASTNNGGSSSGKSSDLSLLIKETMPLPRKLVRGQDVWLGKGAEQTRQILKCMWCGQSFRSLAEMTSHMQETQHYTNIISQEQIISWKSSDDKGSNAATSPSSASPTTATGPSTNVSPAGPAASSSAANSGGGGSGGGASSNSATVSAVLTCKVCDQAFPSLKELSNHMVKNAHYTKDHMMRSTPAGGVGGGDSPQAPKRGRQPREKRKKSLPVRKLLELERAQQDFKVGSLEPALKPLRDFAASTKITCEKCGDKIETALFVDHIRQCLGGSIAQMAPRHHHSTPKAAAAAAHKDGSRHASPRTPSRGSVEEHSLRPDILCPLPKEGEKAAGSAPSVLNAIEQLIEKSFDTRSRHGSAFGPGGQPGTPLGSSILKRLGIDDSVDYTKPLMDAQTMHFLRSYSGYGAGGVGGGGGVRDRSASESSSVSERGSSRLESVTPERVSRQATPRLTPEKLTGEGFQQPPPPPPPPESMRIKSEPGELGGDTAAQSVPPTQKISVKKEFAMTSDDREDEDAAHHAYEECRRRQSLTPGSRPISPSLSERSATPHSASSVGGGERKTRPLPPPVGGSLNALSSMFDNLSSMTGVGAGAGAGAGVGPGGPAASNKPEANNNNHNTPTLEGGSHHGKKSNANPLAALQKLCETTDPPAANTRSGSSSAAASASGAQPTLLSSASSSTGGAAASIGAGGGGGGNGGGGGGAGGNMVAFSWACNDAVMTAADSIIKCSFCDTPFCSKGAYRHHLSKVHFVRDGADPHDAQPLKASPAASPKSAPSPSSRRSASKSPAAAAAAAAASSPVALMASPPIINPYSESPQSKFLKYTELAKQLSSKNV